MIHPHTELRFINEKIGFGVVATKFIPKGTITWALDKLDRSFAENDVQALGDEYFEIIDKYCYLDNKGNYVLCWDISRYINHSFNSNCITSAYDFELAVRDIAIGEELTNDYGYLNLQEPWNCLPETGSSRTTVKPDDLVNFHEMWDQKLLEAFRYFSKVEQPLSKFLKANTLLKANEIAAGREKMDSILNCYYNKITGK